MRILGLNISVKRQPRQETRLVVLEQSLESHEQVLHAVVDRLGIVERKAEATRRKVYRDGEEQAPLDQQEAAPLTKLEELQPGDIVPQGVNF